MPWPIRGMGKLMSDPKLFTEHEGMQKHAKPQWEESLDPEGFSVSQAGFKGGDTLPAPVKRGNIEDDFSGPVFSKLTGQQLDIYSTPSS